jgi:hypothetical protein
MKTKTIIVLVFIFATGCDFGTEGELGRGNFIYSCPSNEDDPECSDTGGARTIPSAVAVGGSFSLSYDADDGRSFSIAPASYRHADSNVVGFAVSLAGPTGFFSLDWNGRIYDLVHVRAHEVSTLELRCYDDDAWFGDWDDCGAALQIELGELTTIEAVPESAAGQVLGGTLDYSWEIADTSIVSLNSSGSRRIVEIRAEAPGSTTLVITAGGATSQLEIFVAGEGDTDTDTDTDSDADTDADTDTDAGVDAGVDAGGE